MQITTGARQLEEIADEEPDFFTMDQSEEIELSSLILDSKRTRLSHGPESLAQAFFEQVAAIPIPNDEQYQDIFRDLGRGGIARQQAIHALVTGNLRYVFLWAKRYYTAARRSRMTFLDVIQEGGRGLQRAAEKFKPELGYKFTTYATWWIKQLITRAIYNCYGPYRIPVHVHETNRQIRKSSTNLDPDLDFSEVVQDAGTDRSWP